jgi:hypothetical protein
VLLLLLVVIHLNPVLLYLQTTLQYVLQYVVLPVGNQPHQTVLD